jgi:hypothetical protein
VIEATTDAWRVNSRDASIFYLVARSRSQVVTARSWLLTEKLACTILDRPFYNKIAAGDIRDVGRLACLGKNRRHEQL